MAKDIQPELKKIGAYLKLDKDVKFVIPEYQRAYSWGINNCDKLWQDILDFTKDSNKDKDYYFFGTIIINCQNDDQEYLLIDGQQRTTTFLLLLKSLLIHINNALNEKGETDSDYYRLLEDRRKEIIPIIYGIDKDDVSRKPNNEDVEKIYKKFRIENKSINEQYKKDLKDILESTNYEDAEKEVIKFPKKTKR